MQEVAASAADATGVDLAGLLGMLTALGVTYVYGRGQRLSVDRGPVRSSRTLPPVERR